MPRPFYPLNSLRSYGWLTNKYPLTPFMLPVPFQQPVAESPPSSDDHDGHGMSSSDFG